MLYGEDKNKVMKNEYKKQLLDYIDQQLDKLTVKQIRVLISSYARCKTNLDYSRC